MVFLHTLDMRLAVTLGSFGIPVSVATYMMYSLLDMTLSWILADEGVEPVLEYS